MFSHLEYILRVSLIVCCVLAVPGCQTASMDRTSASVQKQTKRYAIVIHGGAGAIKADRIKADQYINALTQALTIGLDRLASGGEAVDAVEQVIRFMEDNALFNAGKGAVFTHDETHELDASIMDGRDLSCGAVTGVTTVKNPISLARLVKEKSRHVLFAADGAEAFADRMGVDREPQEYFHTEKMKRRIRSILDKEKSSRTIPEHHLDHKFGTVGCVVLDRYGNLAAGTSTGGLTDKRYGRVGDSPIVGAGTYADNRTCAISCTGTGEEFIRNVVAFQISARMAFGGETLKSAADHVVHDVLKPGMGGVIGVNKTGDMVMSFNTQGMFRGAADANGLFEVKIWR